MKKFKKHRDYGFFDQDIRLSKLSRLGDPLEKLNKGIDFEVFRKILEENLSKLAKGKGGRPPYDYILLFKILILQRFYNLSDDQIEYQVNDRMSFMRFLNLTISNDVHDSKTVCNFREKLIDLGIIDDLFSIFMENLVKFGLIINQGRIIDASFVEFPRQRNKKEENETIKNGEIPEKFKENPKKMSQKDTDARWTKKNNINYFGYKNHIKVDAKSKIIIKYMVTDASVHDSQALEGLLDEKDEDRDLHADSAYTGKNLEKTISDRKMTGKIIEKSYKNKPLTDEQKLLNMEKSRIRSRVEHVFGFIEQCMNRMEVKNIGIQRVTTVIGLMNLTYNIFRKVQLMG